MRPLAIVAFLVAVLLAGIVGWVLGGGGGARPTEPTPFETAVAPATGRDPKGEPHEAELDAGSDERVAAPAAELRADDVLITPALQRRAEAEMRRGWGSVRKDEMPQDDLGEGATKYEAIVLDTPYAIGRELGERRTKAEAALEDARTGGVFALLEKLDGGGVGPLVDVVRGARFEDYFAREAPERRRHPRKDHPDQDVEDGVTLSWPAGVFRLRGLMDEKDPFPRDVTLEGAGIDATMLVLHSSLDTRGRLRNFAIRDCTVHTDGRYLFDLRREPASMRFERVRFIGFDAGAGASCLLGTRALALTARGCRFEGGYGRHPQHGQPFDVRTDGLLARFEGCTFSLVNLGIYHWRGGATAVFLGCTLDRILDDAMGQAASKPGVVFDGCSYSRFEGPLEQVPKLDLNALFPGWQQRIE